MKLSWPPAAGARARARAPCPPFNTPPFGTFCPSNPMSTTPRRAGALSTTARPALRALGNGNIPDAAPGTSKKADGQRKRGREAERFVRAPFFLRPAVCLNPSPIPHPPSPTPTLPAAPRLRSLPLPRRPRRRPLPPRPLRRSNTFSRACA